MDARHVECFELLVDRDEGAPDRVRRWVSTLPPKLPSDVTLLTHELVVNALEHTDTDHIWVVVLVLPDAVRVQVANAGRGDPAPLPAGPFAENGRGLRWIDALSEDWGVERTGATHVWFQVPRATRVP